MYHYVAIIDCWSTSTAVRSCPYFHAECET